MSSLLKSNNRNLQEILTTINELPQSSGSGSSFNVAIVSPEMFGAFGDGIKDDTEAVQACVNHAKSNRKTMIGAGKYKTSDTIDIYGNFASIEINSIYYEGVDYAVRINGCSNNISINTINSQNGGGILLESDIATSYNDIHVIDITSGKTCIKYNGTNSSIVSNRLTFGFLKTSSDYNCIDISPEDRINNVFTGNNCFIGGRLIGGNWAVYGAKENDSFITCNCEGVKNGIFAFCNGGINVMFSRFAELRLQAIDNTKPNLPKIEGMGVVFKTQTDTNQYGSNCSMYSKVILGSETNLMPVNIDVSDNVITTKQGGVIPKHIGSLNINACSFETRGGIPLSKEIMVFGKHLLIKNPLLPRKTHITALDVGYRGDYTETDVDDEFILSYEFVIDEAGCDYTLPPSYDMIAYDSFTITQPSGTSCVFRDWRGTVIFDGAEYGEGKFMLKARLADDCTVDFYDNRNQVWEVKKINDVDTLPVWTGGSY